jgi:hypothetical protein
MTLRPAYRVWQFLSALGLARNSVDRRMLDRYLNAAQIGLFLRMPAAEQAHAFAVLSALPQVEQSPLALAQGALLHDAGKVGGRIGLWHRVAAVLLLAIHPQAVRMIAKDNPASWRYPFFVLEHHAGRSADLAEEAGADPLAVALIRWHHTAPEESGLDPGGQALLALLQSADEQS